jgi:hypothetical protein
MQLANRYQPPADVAAPPAPWAIFFVCSMLGIAHFVIYVLPWSIAFSAAQAVITSILGIAHLVIYVLPLSIAFSAAQMVIAVFAITIYPYWPTLLLCTLLAMLVHQAKASQSDYKENASRTELYNTHEEFNDTPLGCEHLAKMIEKAEEAVADQKAKLAASEAQCTLFNAAKGVILRALGRAKAHDEAGFELFLSKVDPGSLRLYKRCPDLALYLCRDPWSARLYGLHEEFNNTAGFRKELAQKLEMAERAVNDLKVMLAASE